MVDLRLTVDGGEGIPLSVGEPPGVSLEIGTAAIGGRLPDYTGPTTVTPSSNAQTLSTAGTSLNSDITVNPIPSNYGLVTWNGSVITVS